MKQIIFIGGQRRFGAENHSWFFMITKIKILKFEKLCTVKSPRFEVTMEEPDISREEALRQARSQLTPRGFNPQITSVNPRYGMVYFSRATRI